MNYYRTYSTPISSSIQSLNPIVFTDSNYYSEINVDGDLCDHNFTYKKNGIVYNVKDAISFIEKHIKLWNKFNEESLEHLLPVEVEVEGIKLKI